jgi:hypothetical protein
MRIVLALTAVMGLDAAAAMAQTGNPPQWPPLQRRFESTGGGGWIIDRYHPVVIGDRCVTPFSAISPAGQEFRNIAVFEAVRVAGGVLCTNGRFRAEDGSGDEGTTPLRVFIRDDGARFRSP